MADLLDTNVSDMLANPRLSKNDKQRAMRHLVGKASQWWDRRAAFREERRQNRNYFRGRQWEELVRNENGEWVQEKTYIAGQGRIAMVMNLTANIVNNIHGQFMQNKSERGIFAVEQDAEDEVRAMNLARRAVRRQNDSHVIEADNAREHFLSGASGFKSVVVWRPELNRHEIQDYAVEQSRFFYNLDTRDRRFRDLDIIGEIHDVSLDNIFQQFAKSRADMDRIEGMLDHASAAREYYGDHGLETHDFSTRDAIDFNSSVDPGLHRVIELWTPVYTWVRMGFDPLFEFTQGYEEILLPENEITKIQNIRRQLGQPLLELDERRYEPIWHYYFATTSGDVLSEGSTPYWHGEHPYSLGTAIHIDGETWGIVNNIRDPQRWINRLIAQIDHSMGAGAKGALGLDENVLDNSTMSEAEILDNYSRADGVIKLNLGDRTWEQAIRQLQSAPLQAGHFELIPMLMAFVEKISGISEAAQGFSPHAGTPAALYERQVVQASVNALPYLQSYFETLRMKDRKELQLLQQSISEPREYRSEKPGEGVIRYDPEAVRNVMMDVAIGDVNDTNTHREQQEQWLMNLTQTGALPPQVYLAMSSNPRAPEALKMFQSLMEAAQNQP